MKQNILFIFLLFTFSSCFKQTANSETEKWESIAENVEIIRDDFGVPHIYGKTDAEAVFGLLYAQCEDDFNRVEQNYIWATGRLAETEGESALYSDLRAKLYMTEEEAKMNYDKAPDWLKKLCDAFADGVNYYLHTHPEVKPRVITRFEPWMPLYFSEGSIGGDIERISTKKLKDFYGPQDQAAVHNGMISIDDGEPKGSNGFAISGKLTESGNAMLLINPHTSFFFRGEVHVVSEEGMNAYGAVTWGQFFVYQGFNEKNGWMHTSSYGDVIDEFEETINQEDGLKYKYGEEMRPVQSQEVVLKYKDGDEIKEKTFAHYRTHHGPITHKNGDRWVATAIMWKPVEALIQSYTRTKMSSYEEFDKMMDIRTNSSNNTVYADSDGNIAYYQGNFIPKRNSSFDFSNPVDGSNPATDWLGVHELDETMKIFNPGNGWIQNCNATPFTAAGEFSPKKEDYPNYMWGVGENFRQMNAIRLLSKAENLNIDRLITLAYDPLLVGFEKLIPGIIEAYDKQGSKNPNAKEAIDILGNWDYKVSIDSKAMSIGHYYASAYRDSKKAPMGMDLTEAITYYGSKSPLAERISIFEEAIDQLKADFGSVSVPWGEINRYQRLNGDIEQDFNDEKPSHAVGMTSSRWGALASFAAKQYPGTKRIYGTSGNSFVAVVEFGDKVIAKSMLAGGQSGDPSSPHFDDQVQRYIDVQFKDVPYYKEDVLKRAKKTYHPGE
ncbi:Acyl-homoserine lactone (AHL) acylase PvdQ [Spirosomataceae bacterium TFI 002]|nr:Acyl-homoserine lactone (AHL) acylase PvdQ [Spirosomataceae bacterium TFI 002]